MKQTNTYYYSLQEFLQKSVTLQQLLTIFSILVLLTTLSILLYYQHTLITLQTDQLTQLTHSLQNLQQKYDNLKHSLDQSDILLKDLQTQLAENASGQSHLKILQNSTDLNSPEYIRAKNEQRMVTFQIIAAVVASAVVLYCGYGLYSKFNSPWIWEFAHSKFKGVAQKFGYMPDIDKYTHIQGDTFWQFHVTNKEQVSALVKYPGSGDYVDAYELVIRLLPKMSRHVHVQTTDSFLAQIDPALSASILDSVTPLPDSVHALSNAASMVINTIPLY